MRGEGSKMDGEEEERAGGKVRRRRRIKGREVL